MKGIQKSGKATGKEGEIEEESGGKVGHLNEISLNFLVYKSNKFFSFSWKRACQYSPPQPLLILSLTKQSIFDNLNYIAILNIINFV